MTIIRAFTLGVSTQELKTFFSTKNVDTQTINWHQSHSQVAEALVNTFNGLPIDHQQQIKHDIERICLLSESYAFDTFLRLSDYDEALLDIDIPLDLSVRCFIERPALFADVERIILQAHEGVLNIADVVRDNNQSFENHPKVTYAKHESGIVSSKVRELELVDITNNTWQTCTRLHENEEEHLNIDAIQQDEPSWADKGFIRSIARYKVVMLSANNEREEFMLPISAKSMRPFGNAPATYFEGRQQSLKRAGRLMGIH